MMSKGRASDSKDEDEGAVRWAGFWEKRPRGGGTRGMMCLEDVWKAAANGSGTVTRGEPSSSAAERSEGFER